MKKTNVLISSKSEMKTENLNCARLLAEKYSQKGFGQFRHVVTFFTFTSNQRLFELELNEKKTFRFDMFESYSQC